MVFALCVQRQEDVSGLATYPHHDLMVGLWPLSSSWCWRNSCLGSGHQLNMSPLKAVVQGWVEVSQVQAQGVGQDELHL